MIKIRNLKKSFDSSQVLRGVNLDINDGETIVIAGRSGCGKTVLLKSIIGLIKADEGEISVDGIDVSELDRKGIFELRKRFGMLFQGAALFDSLTVEENVGLALMEHTEYSEDEIRTRVREKLRMVGLEGIEKKKPAELSGGMKKRVGLARALIMNPKYLLFDEPTTGLDPVMADTINNLIIETNRSLSITSIVVTHDMVSAFRVGDRIAMLSNGIIVFEGTPQEFQKSKNAAVTEFLIEY